MYLKICSVYLSAERYIWLECLTKSYDSNCGNVDMYFLAPGLVYLYQDSFLDEYSIVKLLLWLPNIPLKVFKFVQQAFLGQN